jgi:thymidylate synthase
LRIFADFYAAGSEVLRDLSEMGVITRIQSMQDKTDLDDDLAITKEVIGYSFTVLTHDRLDDMLEIFRKVPLETAKNYIDAEFADRVCGEPLNPGNAWQLRAETWEQFMAKQGGDKMSYTYAERYCDRLDNVVAELKRNPGTRQAIHDVYRGDLDMQNWGGKKRIPCSILYQFFVRDGAVHILYFIRSNDLLEHFCYDLALTARYQEYVAEKLGLPVGDLIYMIGSLHSYKKDLDARGIF